jgi:antitoxin component YwqK of YwqJK toxin-antitoxin module
MLNLLHNNLIEYILNLYLDYEKDILKLKQLFPQYKFSIKPHLAYTKIFDKYGNGIKCLLDNKNKKLIFTYKNGERKIDNYKGNKFKRKILFNNGKLDTEIDFKNDFFHGKRKQWYQNGTLWYEENYKNGEREGYRVEYDQRGILIYDENYKNDLLHGIQLMYYDDENLKSRCNYKNGIKNGIYKEWNEDGSLLYEYKYVDGINTTLEWTMHIRDAITNKKEKKRKRNKRILITFVILFGMFFPFSILLWQIIK